jgi:ectoine hydroxylase-related dioxygenase (phytanoyl-CoA dioxygenase family)
MNVTTAGPNVNRRKTGSRLDLSASGGHNPAVRISDQHAAELVRRGYAVVPNFLDGPALSAARENLARYFPSADEWTATPERYGFIADDPEHLQVEFPFAGPALNDVSTHPEIVGFVERILGTDDVRLSQAAIWAKYAGTGDFEQGLHLDYQGNTLVVPRDDGDYRQVNMILYYTDVPADMGPTYVVSQEKTADLPIWPTHRTRKRNAELYGHERPVLANAGDLLIFGMRTWHRASQITADSGGRFSHHLVYRSGRHDFQGYHHWPRFGENELLSQFVTRATPRQREVLGFPKASDPYWTDQTRAAVRLRYPGIVLPES